MFGNNQIRRILEEKWNICQICNKCIDAVSTKRCPTLIFAYLKDVLFLKLCSINHSSKFDFLLCFLCFLLLNADTLPKWNSNSTFLHVREILSLLVDIFWLSRRPKWRLWDNFFFSFLVCLCLLLLISILFWICVLFGSREKPLK